ncbi:MAG: iron chelate uptake ABC transporter family permease subunit [Desulfurococcaceae archaeon]
MSVEEALLKRRRKWKLYALALSAALALTLLFSLCVGSYAASYGFHPLDALKVILRRLSPSVNVDPTFELVVLAIRLPRVLMGCVVGASLSLAGALMQGIFRNPMADPYIVGVSSGASLGAALAIVLGVGFVELGSATIPAMAFLVAMLTLIAVYNMSRVGGRVPVMTLLLSGIAMSILLSSITSFISLFAGSKLHGLYFWLLGSLSTARWSHVYITVPALVTCAVIAILYARELNIMSMGEETALTLGVDVETTKMVLIAVSALVTSSAVSFTGVIAFVGLIVPHIVRFMVGPDHRVLLPCSTLFGATLLVICDDVARIMLPSTEVPVGIVTALIGGPFFVYLLKRRRSYKL